MRDLARDEADEIRQWLLEESFPRLQMSAIVAIAGLLAFFCSAGLLALGVSSMALRYLAAASVGYLAFLALIRAWIAIQRRRLDVDSFEEVLSIDLPSRHGSGDPSFEPDGGGGFGGAGAGRSFDAAAPDPLRSAPPIAEAAHPGTAFSGGLGDVADLDAGWPVAIALAGLLLGAAALGFVVYASPILFAEVLLDAAVVGAIYRRARRRSRAHWLRGVLRRTWLPAAAVCAFVALVGLGVQTALPGARSLGDVVRAANAR